jgi:glycine oxidase
MTGTTAVLVIGGGAIGLAVARAAARAGLSVRLLERGMVGGEASGASAGMLAAQLETHAPAALQALALRSRHLYPGFVRELEAESGVEVDLQKAGALLVARDAASAAKLEATHRLQSRSGLPGEILDGDGLRLREAAITDRAVRGLHLPLEWSLDPPRLVRALTIAAERAGVELLERREVRRIDVDRGRIRGVTTADGDRHLAAQVVVAAGAWSGLLEGVAPAPMEPVRGQIVCFEAPGCLRHVVADESVYLVPRGDGRILAGSTMERVGFDRRVTATGVAGLTTAAIDLIPALGSASFRTAWAGLRPGAPDGLPLIGAGEFEGLFYACGHLRHGIVLTPITAQIVERLLRGADPGVALEDWSPRRFTGAGPAAS